MAKRIKTSLIRSLVLFYSIFGIHLYNLKQFGLIETLHFIKNIFIHVCLVHLIVNHDLFEIGQLSIIAENNQKPLVSFVLKLLGKQTIHLMLLFSIWYYFIIGARLVNLFDSEIMYRIYHKNDRIKRITLLLASIYLIIFFFMHHNFIMLIVYSNQPKTIIIWLKVPTMFIIYVQAYFTGNIILLHQYGIKKNLQMLEHQLNEYDTNECINAIENIRIITNFNNQTNSLISFPFFIFILMNTISSILVLCIIILLHSKTSWSILTLLSYPLASYSIIFTFISINNESQQILKRICSRLRQSSHCHQSVRCIGLTSMYIENLQLRIYDLIQIDGSFMLYSSVAIINFVVFIAQTN